MSLLSQDRDDGPMEAHLGPFATGAPGLGYREYLAEFDEAREMWRQISPGQRGRGLALGLWGLQMYPEYGEDPNPASYEGDPLWVPILVEWASLTVLDGVQIKPDPAYLERFHTEEVEGGEDALPMVGIHSVHSTWPALVGAWSAFSPEGFWWEMFEVTDPTDTPEMVMPVQHVLPLEDDQLLASISESIENLGRHWPMDECSPSQPDDWMDSYDHNDWHANVLLDGHSASCFEQQANYGAEFEFLKCTWDWQKRCCQPCGGGPHITAVVDSFVENLPYESKVFNPLLLPHWEHLKDRNLRFYSAFLRHQETERSKGRSWYYSYAQRWSPWAHSSQVPGQLLV